MLEGSPNASIAEARPPPRVEINTIAHVFVNHEGSIFSVERIVATATATMAGLVIILT